ncbi:MAG: hypothetical protein AAGH19_12375 [Pseudomonadota bacterium]
MDTSGLLIVGSGLALVLVLTGVFLFRRRKDGADAAGPEPVSEVQAERRTEPTLTAEPETGVAEASEPALEETAAEEIALEETAVRDETEASPPEPVHADADSAAEAKTDPEPEKETAPEPEAQTASEPETKTASEPAKASEGPDDATPALDPAFLEVRTSLERELSAGHFSKLDVFEDYRLASEKASGRIGSRSEYFHQVVEQALEVRDTFEGMLSDEDRERFIDVHSRYLDEVSVEADLDVRARLHSEQVKLLNDLGPRVS